MKSGPQLDALIEQLIMKDGKQLPYSADMGAAWKVVEKLGVEGFMLINPPKQPTLWSAGWTDAAGASASADTPAHAICEAALEYAQAIKGR